MLTGLLTLVCTDATASVWHGEFSAKLRETGGSNSENRLIRERERWMQLSKLPLVEIRGMFLFSELFTRESLCFLKLNLWRGRLSLFLKRARCNTTLRRVLQVQRDTKVFVRVCYRNERKIIFCVIEYTNVCNRMLHAEERELPENF